MAAFKATGESGNHQPAGLTSDGGQTATLRIPSSLATEEVALSGIGRPPIGVLSVTPASLEFDAHETGTTSPPQTVTVTDIGDAPLTLGQPALTGPSAGEFKLGDGCSEVTLDSGSSCHVDLAFAPTVDGAQVATLQVPSSVGTQTVSVGGTGQAPAPPPPALSAPPANGSPEIQPAPNAASAMADLRVHLGGLDRAVVGKRLEIHLTISNRGPQTASSIGVTVKLTGAALEDVEIDGAKCRGGRRLVCAVGSLALGDHRRLEITATPRRAGRFDVVTGVRSTTADPTPGNDRDQWAVKVTQG